MQIDINSAKNATVIVRDPTPITDTLVSLIIGTDVTVPLEPSDCFAIGDALKTAARKVGYTPPGGSP